MKTITTTFHFVHNFGAVLQTFALQQALLNCGIENRVLNYQYYTPRIFRKVKVKFSKGNLKAFLDNLVYVLNYTSRKKKFDRFEKFIHERILLTPKINDYQELHKITADAFITGSDQVWNLHAGIIKPFDLAFVPENIKRYSYAASMGRVDNYKSADDLERFLGELYKYSGISVREQRAKDFLQSHGINDVKCHIDPVFLLSSAEWKELIGEPLIKGKYVLCYQLLKNKMLPDVVKKIKQRTKLPVYGFVEGFEKTCWDYNIYDAGPIEFLNYIYYAEKVVTTSFHGTAFSILFQKDFLALNNAASPERISNLLELTGLKSRLISSLDDIEVADEHISYSGTILHSLECEKIKGLEYLQSLKI